MSNMGNSKNKILELKEKYRSLMSELDSSVFIDSLNEISNKNLEDKNDINKFLVDESLDLQDKICTLEDNIIHKMDLIKKASESNSISSKKNPQKISDLSITEFTNLFNKMSTTNKKNLEVENQALELEELSGDLDESAKLFDEVLKQKDKIEQLSSQNKLLKEKLISLQEINEKNKMELNSTLYSWNLTEKKVNELEKIFMVQQSELSSLDEEKNKLILALEKKLKELQNALDDKNNVHYQDNFENIRSQIFELKNELIDLLKNINEKIDSSKQEGINYYKEAINEINTIITNELSDSKRALEEFTENKIDTTELNKIIKQELLEVRNELDKKFYNIDSVNSSNSSGGNVSYLNRNQDSIYSNNNFSNDNSYSKPIDKVYEPNHAITQRDLDNKLQSNFQNFENRIFSLIRNELNILSEWKEEIISKQKSSHHQENKNNYYENKEEQKSNIDNENLKALNLEDFNNSFIKIFDEKLKSFKDEYINLAIKQNEQFDEKINSLEKKVFNTIEDKITNLNLKSNFANSVVDASSNLQQINESLKQKSQEDKENELFFRTSNLEKDVQNKIDLMNNSQEPNSLSDNLEKNEFHFNQNRNFNNEILDRMNKMEKDTLFKVENKNSQEISSLKNVVSSLKQEMLKTNQEKDFFKKRFDKLLFDYKQIFNSIKDKDSIISRSTDALKSITNRFESLAKLVDDQDSKLKDLCEESKNFFEEGRKIISNKYNSNKTNNLYFDDTNMNDESVTDQLRNLETQLLNLQLELEKIDDANFDDIIQKHKGKIV